MRWIAGGATALAGLGVLLAGLLPPNLMATGQVDPRSWVLPLACGVVVVAAVLRWSMGRWRWSAMVPALLALVAPPLVLCLAASDGQAGRLAAWGRDVAEVPVVARRPLVGILSGPVLYGPARGGVLAGFSASPLWEILGRNISTLPTETLFAEGPSVGLLDRVAALLLVQPRALAPEELVALDGWVRRGGRLVVLADPDLRWADERALGHPQRPPPVTLLDPLLDHWGLILAPAPAHPPAHAGADPLERRFLDGADAGRMVQIAGASHFLPTATRPEGMARCSLSSGGLVARCAPGRGQAILIADADFAHDPLWTSDPGNPARTAAWTSDAAALLAEWLVPGSGEAAGRRVWLTRADGLPEALRPALLTLLLFVTLTIVGAKPRRTKQDL